MDLLRFLVQNFISSFFLLSLHASLLSKTWQRMLALPQAMDRNESENQHMYTKTDIHFSQGSVSCNIYIKLYKFRCFSSRLEIRFFYFFRFSPFVTFLHIRKSNVACVICRKWSWTLHTHTHTKTFGLTWFNTRLIVSCSLLAK